RDRRATRIVHLAGHVPSRRNAEREHRQPGVRDWSTPLRTRHLDSAGPADLPPTDDRVDPVRHATESAGVPWLLRRLAGGDPHERTGRRRTLHLVRHQRVLQGRWHRVQNRLLDSGWAAVRIAARGAREWNRL